MENKLNLKKGLTYIVIGFLFTFISLNLKLNTANIDITPDYVGWILIFMGFDLLGDYVKDMKYLKWAAIGMAVLSLISWILAALSVSLDPDYLSTFINLAMILYFYFLLDPIEKIAEDNGSLRVSSIRTVRMAMLGGIGLSVILFVLSFFADEKLTLFLVVMVMIIQVYVTIALAFDLFLVRKEISEKLKENENDS